MYPIAFVCILGDSPPERPLTPTDSIQGSSLFGFTGQAFSSNGNKLEKVRRAASLGRFDVKVNESPLAAVLGGSVDLASHCAEQL